MNISGGSTYPIPGSAVTRRSLAVPLNLHPAAWPQSYSASKMFMLSGISRANGRGAGRRGNDVHCYKPSRLRRRFQNSAGPLARLDPQRQEADPARNAPRNGAGSGRRTADPRRAGLRPGTVRGNLLPSGEKTQVPGQPGNPLKPRMVQDDGRTSRGEANRPGRRPGPAHRRRRPREPGRSREGRAAAPLAGQSGSDGPGRLIRRKEPETTGMDYRPTSLGGRQRTGTSLVSTGAKPAPVRPSPRRQISSWAVDSLKRTSCRQNPSAQQACTGQTVLRYAAVNGEEGIAAEAPSRETEAAHRPIRHSPWASHLHGESEWPLRLDGPGSPGR